MVIRPLHSGIPQVIEKVSVVVRAVMKDALVAGIERRIARLTPEKALKFPKTKDLVGSRACQ